MTFCPVAALLTVLPVLLVLLLALVVVDELEVDATEVTMVYVLTL